MKHITKQSKMSKNSLQNIKVSVYFFSFEQNKKMVIVQDMKTHNFQTDRKLLVFFSLAESSV